MSKAKVIYRVLRGIASDAERDELQHWIAASEANREEYEDLKLVYRLSQRAGVPRDNRYHERFEQIRRKATARLGRKARARQGSRLVGALVCAGLALFLGIHSVIDFRPATFQFQDQTLRQVLSLVERTYGIQVRVDEDALESCRFTGTFYRVDQPDDIIRSISRSVGADFVSTAPGKYRLLGGGC